MNQALRTYGCQKLTFLKFLIIISSFLKITNNHTKKDFVVQNPYFIPMPSLYNFDTSEFF